WARPRRRRSMADRRFENRVAIVTGASSGIGRACARALAREGARVVLGGRRESRLREVAEAIAADGGAAAIAPGDVRDEGACRTVVAAAVESFGGLDLLVNAAGVIGPGSLQQTAPGEWDRVMDSNLRSVYLMMRAAAPALIERRGAVVNLSSVAG